MESLSDKLKSLGVQIGVQQPAQPAPTHKRLAIEQVMAGSYIDTAYGQAFVVEAEHNAEETQGMPNPEHLTILAEWASTPDLPFARREEIIFLDTETSGLAGGTGTFAFMIGLGYFTDHAFKLVQLFMRDPSEEPGLLAGMHHFLGNFKAVVTFNGKSFDIPLLNARHVINGFTSPFQDIMHIDLLPLARRLWRNRLPSRALKDLEVEILDVHRTQEEVPGWMVPELYYNYLRFGQTAPLSGVFYHNGLDVVSMAALFNYTAALLSHPLQNSHVDSLDLIAIARLYDNLDRVEEAIQIYEKSLEQGLPLSFFQETILRFAGIHRKLGNWKGARDLWEKGAQQQSAQACLELAKYYEHQERDYNQALRWAESYLAQNVSESSDDAKARIMRIQRKMNKRLTDRGKENG